MMQVIKRSGRREEVSFDKITARLRKLTYNLDTNYVNLIEVSKKVIMGLYDGVTTVELDNLAAETAATMATVHPDYALLAARIAVSNLHKETEKSFAKVVYELYHYIDPKTGDRAGLIGDDTYKIVMKHKERLESAIIFDRDFEFDYFGFKTLERSYLMRMNGKVVERPQHLFMRVAVGIHREDIDAAIETYNLMSERWFIHATPTLFNAGTPKPQLSSCFAAGTKVFTVNDGVKNIEDVQLGDLVITHKGNVKPVVQLHKNPLNDRQMYRVRVYGSPAIKVTGNHRFWSASKEQLGWEEQPQWNSVEYLREGDYIAIPNKKEKYQPETLDLMPHVPMAYGNIELEVECDDNWIYPTSVWERKHRLNPTDATVMITRKHNAVKRNIVIDKDFAFLLGVWLGDGHVLLGRDLKKTHQFIRGIGFTAYYEAYELIGKITALCKQIFGVEAFVSTPTSTNTVSITVNSHVVGHAFDELFGRKFDGKRLATFMYRWDKEMVQAFMEGLTTSDGCVTQSGDVRITMSNINLVKEIYALCRNVGMEVAYSEASLIKRGATAKTARISLPKKSVLLENVLKQYDDDRLERMKDAEPLSSYKKEIEGVKFLRIMEKVKVDDRPEFVYTLGVADDHSYVVEGVVAENCFLLTMTEDSIAGIFETLSRCALISQSAGGIGLSIHNIRATGSYIKGTGGTSNGIIPMLRVFNDAARYVDQCFHPDTLIYTRHGIKRIDDVVLGEELLTAEGEFNRVTRLLRNAYEGNMVEIGVKHSIEPILVTPGHTFLVLRGQKKMVNHEVITNRLEKGFIEPEWVEAKDLTPDDLIAFPIPEFFEDIPEYSLDDCRFYGMMIGDGHIARDGKAAHITQNRDTDDINFVKKYLYENGIRWTESPNPIHSSGQTTLSRQTAAHASSDDSKSSDEWAGQKKVRFTWSAHLGFKFSRAMLYDEQGEKRVHPSMLHLPKEKTLQIIKGILETDGSISSRENFEIALDMTSRNVIESVRYMLMRFGILTSGYVRDRVGNVSIYKNITTRKVSYCLRIPKVPEITDLFGREAGEYTTFFTYGNHTYSRVTHLVEQPFDGVVVDFEVEPQHNYVTHVGVAHNGGGKRKGAFAVYLEPWHADVFEFLELKKNHGKEEMRARDLFYAMWISDLFMERVKADKDWSLFDPNEAPGLFDVYGAKFEALYHQYEQEGRQRKTVKARELWNAILESQIETGTPYILYKDAANKKSNQQNLGTIRSSNLCTEIIEYTSKDEVAVCNLASMALPKFVTNGKFDFEKLFEITRVVTRNLNKVIDINYYPIPEARNSNFRHRPIGLGVQGLADAFILMGMAFDSEGAKQLNKDIFETIYFAAVTESANQAEKHGAYETFKGSPLSKGMFQFDLWGVTPSKRWDWDGLRERVKKVGVRNSLLVAPMPTASTSQILGNNECFEPYTSNLYTRRTLAGEHIVVNKHLMRDLVRLGLWNEEMREAIMAANGSIQGIEDIPKQVRDVYKTAYEISQKVIIDMSADRGAFICQSQSLNVFMESPTFAKLSSMHFYAWQKGLKTGMYYLRSKAATDPIKFTLSQKHQQKFVANAKVSEPIISATIPAKEEPPMPVEMSVPEPVATGKVCSLDDPTCEACSA